MANSPDSMRLAALRSRAAALRAELQAVEAAIAAAEAADAVEAGMEDALVHHRPSYSFFGGAEETEETELELPTLRQLGAKDQDFDSVLQEHPKLKIDPIGSFNHWDRRECAVVNGQEWTAACEKYMKDLGGCAKIPKVIHQIWVGPKEPPCLWIDTFRSDYLEANPDWKFELWSDEQVLNLPMFNAEIYFKEKMWQCKADVLRLEFLWHYGGVYVDADMISVGSKSLNPIIEIAEQTGFAIAYEPDTKDKPYSILGNSVIACTPHHPLILMLILFLKQTYYQKRDHVEVFAVTGPVMYTKCLVDCGMPISIADQELLYPAFHFVPNPDAIDFSRFPKCLMFQFGYTCSGLEGYVKRRNRCKKPFECPFHMKSKFISSFRALPHGDDTELYGQVPISLAYMEDHLTDGSIPLENGTVMFITDGELVQLDGLRNEAPGFVDRIGQPWDVMLLGMEWSTGHDETTFWKVPPGGRPRNANVVGLLVNVHNVNSWDRDMRNLQPVLHECITEKGFDPSPLFNAADRISLWFAAQKFAGTLEEARVWKCMPLVHKVFTEMANHTPPLHFDTHEMHGNLIKGKLNERMVFEMVVEPNGGLMFRSWNDDNSPNCELKTNPSKVEWMKVFFNHQVAYEAQNKPLP